MPSCKKCGKTDVVKNGNVRGKQRYLCKSCHCNFVEGDLRVKEHAAIKRAFAVILYGTGKASYGFIAKLFGVTPAAVMKWLDKEAARLGYPTLSANIQDLEVDEVWHFIQSKKRSSGSSRRWIVLQAEPWPGCSAVVMLQPSGGFGRKSGT